MVKLNKKGFMMAEVVVVSAIILVSLAALYEGYSKLYSVFKTRLNYNDTNVIYKIAYYRDILIDSSEDENNLNSALLAARTSNYIDINTTYASLFSDDIFKNEKVLLVANSGNNLNDMANIGVKNAILGYADINVTFKDYVKYLSTSVDLTDTNYVFIMEKCYLDDENDCKYGYLKIYDGHE